MIAKTDRVATRNVCALALFVAACGASAPTAAVGTSTVASATKIDFVFDSLDDRPVTSEALRGKPTLMVFVQTGDPWSQAQVNFFVAMANNDADKVNYVLVALEPRTNRELVEAYRQSLHVTFPVAFADAASLTGTGPFGEWRGMPTTVLLDRAGLVRWRVDGHVVKSDELRAQLHGL